MRFVVSILAVFILSACAGRKPAEQRIAPSVGKVKTNISIAQQSNFKAVVANERLARKLDLSTIRSQRLRDKIIILLERHRKMK